MQFGNARGPIGGMITLSLQPIQWKRGNTTVRLCERVCVMFVSIYFFALIINACTEKIKPQSSLVSAIIKNGQDHGRRGSNMTSIDRQYAKKFLDSKLMKAFKYKHPVWEKTAETSGFEWMNQAWVGLIDLLYKTTNASMCRVTVELSRFAGKLAHW